jgi:hypothetical protein
MTNYNLAKSFTRDHFDIIVDWTYEDQSLESVFDFDEEELQIMCKRCDDYIDTYYVARVRAMYQGIEMGVDYLGSCYASDCTPKEDIEKGISGYLDQMVDTAVTEAKQQFATLLADMTEESTL